jgi:hypothetical protein
LAQLSTPEIVWPSLICPYGIPMTFPLASKDPGIFNPVLKIDFTLHNYVP